MCAASTVAATGPIPGAERSRAASWASVWLARIVAAGGRQRMPVREYYPGEKPYRMVYVEDPFGIVFELYSHSYELTYSAGAYA